MKIRLLGCVILVASAVACGDDGGNAASTCGDGAVGGTEQCDDGNTVAGDGCSATCSTETLAACGNATREGTEQCDDGNTTAGDGCSATCQTEPDPMCGNGTLEGTEQCDDGNVLAGDGCSATCTPEVCGDGMISGVEQCDDGNLTAADGCTACAEDAGSFCTGQPSICVMRSGTCAAPFKLALVDTAGTLAATGVGDTTAGTSQVAAAACDSFMSGLGPDHVWELTLTDVRDVTLTIAGTTTFDSVLRLLAAPCDLASEIAELDEPEGCSDTFGNGGETLRYVALPPGTYYVIIDGFDATELGTYSVAVSAVATQCGDGTLDGPEQCDDGNTVAADGCSAGCAVEPLYVCTGTPSVCTPSCGNGLIDGAGELCDDSNTAADDGCSPTCAIEPGFKCAGTPSLCAIACGDGIVDLGEECDDGNALANDRCAVMCTLESDVTEVEPNDATAQVLAAGSHVIRGALTAADVDLYTFTLTGPATIDLETYTTIDGDATNYGGSGTLGPLVDCRADTLINVFDSTGDPMMNTTAIASDDDDGDPLCSYLGPTLDAGAFLQPGTYTIKVNLFLATSVAPIYILDLRITPAPLPVAGSLVMNEFMAADNVSDTNCDASMTGTEDEFIELVNTSTSYLDLTGITIADSVGVRHTFAPRGLRALEAIVVWSGGTPMCASAPNFVVSSTGQLGLNDTGDTITIADAAAVSLITLTYATTTANISANLAVDLADPTTGPASGPYVRHDVVAGGVGDFSPGTRASGAAF